jgi:hypothetical protein
MVRHLPTQAKTSTMVHLQHQAIFKGSSRLQQQMVVVWQHRWAV